VDVDVDAAVAVAVVIAAMAVDRAMVHRSIHPITTITPWLSRPTPALQVMFRK